MQLRSAFEGKYRDETKTNVNGVTIIRRTNGVKWATRGEIKEERDKDK